MTFSALGDAAVMVTVGTGIDDEALPRVRALASIFERDPAPGIVDVVAAYATVTFFYEPARLAVTGNRAYDHVCQLITARTRHLDSEAKKKFSSPGRSVELPVWYGGAAGPDLAEVAATCGLAPDDVVEQHQDATYLVHAIGFFPGFPYLGGLPKKLHVPRRATPRPLVPAGSVGIGGAQTGVYPMATPGGWQLIGRTPVPLFRRDAAEPALLRVGDRVTFRSISAEAFAAWK